MNHLTEQWSRLAAVKPSSGDIVRISRPAERPFLFKVNRVGGTATMWGIDGIRVLKGGTGVYGKATTVVVSAEDVEIVTPAKTAAQRGPVIAYPAGDGKGKWHAINPVAETALCGQPVVLDTRSGNSIHVTPGQARPHPIVCRRCLKAGGWTAP